MQNWIDILADIWQHRYALRNLVLKDFRIRYRNMSLGVLWSVLNPLVLLGMLVLIFTFIFARGTEKYFPVFVLLGLVAYNFLSLCLPVATGCVMENSQLIKKVIFPRHILPISVVMSQAIHVVIQFGLVAVFILVFRVPLGWTCLWVPVILFIELLFVLGAGMLCAALNVYFKDIRYIVESTLTVMFWLSPVFYSLQRVHDTFPRWLYAIYIMNPLAGCIDALRKTILYNADPDWFSMGTATAVSLVTLFLGFWVFGRMQRIFADCI